MAVFYRAFAIRVRFGRSTLHTTNSDFTPASSLEAHSFGIPGLGGSRVLYAFGRDSPWKGGV